MSYAVDLLEVVQFLVEKYPESVSMASRRGIPFHDACRTRGVETVKYLYEKNPSAIKSADYLPFESNRDVDEKLHFLLEKNSELIKVNDPEGNLPLHKACSDFSWDFSRIKMVFELYPDAVATRNLEGRFPLTSSSTLDFSDISTPSGIHMRFSCETNPTPDTCNISISKVTVISISISIRIY